MASAGGSFLGCRLGKGSGGRFLAENPHQHNRRQGEQQQDDQSQDETARCSCDEPERHRVSYLLGNHIRLGQVLR